MQMQVESFRTMFQLVCRLFLLRLILRLLRLESKTFAWKGGVRHGGENGWLLWNVGSDQVDDRNELSSEPCFVYGCQMLGKSAAQMISKRKHKNWRWAILICWRPSQHSEDFYGRELHSLQEEITLLTCKCALRLEPTGRYHSFTQWKKWDGGEAGGRCCCSSDRRRPGGRWLKKATANNARSKSRRQE